MQWRALIRYEGWPFKGNTKSGVNQVLALALGMGDQHGRARDYEVANTNVLWAAATSLAWEEKLNDITPEGTYMLCSQLTTAIEKRQATEWLARQEAADTAQDEPQGEAESEILVVQKTSEDNPTTLGSYE